MAPQGLGVCPVVGRGGLLAGGGPALAGDTAPLEEEVDKGLGAVQPRGSPPCPLSLRLLLLPLLLWGQRGGLEGRGRGMSPQIVFGGRELAGLEGLLGGTDWKRGCCGVQGVSRGHGAGLWGAWQAPGTGLRLCRAIGCLGLVARGPYGLGTTGCQGRGQGLSYRMPRSGDQVSVWLRGYRMLEWGTGSTWGRG